MIKVLITSAGGVNGINVIKALRQVRGTSFSIIASDAQPLVPIRYLSNKFCLLPPASDKNFFINALVRLCKKEGVRIILPMYSTEILELSKKRDELSKKYGIKMAIPSYETIDVTWEKSKTAMFFQKHNIPAPKTYTKNDLRRANASFPLFIKSSTGSGSKEAHMVSSWDELVYHKKHIRKHIVQEYIDGNEYTIDALGDLNGKFVAASPRQRLEVRGGLAVKAITVSDSEMVECTKKIMNALRIVGPANIQCKKTGGKLYFIEINARFASGGLPLAVAAGFNIPFLVVKMLLGQPLPQISIKKNIMMLRYWETLFIKKAGSKTELYYK